MRTKYLKMSPANLLEGLDVSCPFSCTVDVDIYRATTLHDLLFKKPTLLLSVFGQKRARLDTLRISFDRCKPPANHYNKLCEICQTATHLICPETLMAVGVKFNMFGSINFSVRHTPKPR